jgi:hypothetical protein
MVPGVTGLRRGHLKCGCLLFFATFSHGSILVCVALSVILVEHWQES